MSEQAALHLVPPAQNTGGPDIERVKGKLGPVVLEWARGRWGTKASAQNPRPREFHLKQLVVHVWRTEAGEYCSPSSPGRTLQALRLEGWVDYEVVCRSASLYKLTSIVMYDGPERLPG